jgi:DNA-binding IclR family transcriptional regulator
MPLHCTALGKVLLAFSADRGAALLADLGPLIARTPSTITDPERLIAELAEARASGVAYDDGESSPGLHCVAAPVLARNGTVRAALSVSMGTDSELLPRDIASAVRISALALTRELRASGVSV